MQSIYLDCKVLSLLTGQVDKFTSVIDLPVGLSHKLF